MQKAALKICNFYTNFQKKTHKNKHFWAIHRINNFKALTVHISHCQNLKRVFVSNFVHWFYVHCSLVNQSYFQFKNGKEKSSIISIVVTAIIDFLSETNKCCGQ